MAMDFKGRIRSLRQSLERQHVDAMLVTHIPNVRYLCGFTGSSGALLVSSKGAELYTDGRYTLQAKQECQGVRVRIARGNAALSGLKRIGGRKATIGIEA